MEQQATPVYLLIGTPTYHPLQFFDTFPFFKVISVYAGMTSFSVTYPFLFHTV